MHCPSFLRTCLWNIGIFLYCLFEVLKFFAFLFLLIGIAFALAATVTGSWHILIYGK